MSLALGEPGVDTRFGDVYVGSTQIHSVYKNSVDIDSTLTVAVGDTLIIYPGFPSPDYLHPL